MKLNENEDLRYIKKHYGERFAQFCRSNFPTILETPGALKKIISENFAQTRSLFDDLTLNQEDFDNFNNFVNSMFFMLYHANNENEYVINTATPEELFDKAGYILYPECKTVEDVEKFKHYYTEGEVICTYMDVQDRLDNCRIWFAVKKNVNKISRKIPPDRQDEYGTSVLSLQFDKSLLNTLSIKNRYNHGINREIRNPDATFSNNLENIYPGLTEAFARKYDLNLFDSAITEFKNSLYSYILGNDGKLYRSNTCINGDNYYAVGDNKLAFCENNVIVDNNKVIKYEKDKFLLFDGFIIDLHKKIITSYLNGSNDEFIKSIGKYKDIIISNEDENGNKTITIIPASGKDIEIMIDKHNSIISYNNENVTEVGDTFLALCQNVSNLNMPNLKKAGKCFLNDNLFLQTYNLESLEEVGDCFMPNNIALPELDMPSLKKVGDYFFSFNDTIEKVNLPSLEFVGNRFLCSNEQIKDLNLPCLKLVGNNFLSTNNGLKTFDAQNLEEVGDYFLRSCSQLDTLNVKNLVHAGNGFVEINKKLKTLDMPYLESVGKDFMPYNEIIETINMPYLVKVKDYFLSEAKLVKNINLDSLVYYGNGFIRSKRILIKKIKQEALRKQALIKIKQEKTRVSQDDDLSK